MRRILLLALALALTLGASAAVATTTRAPATVAQPAGLVQPAGFQTTMLGNFPVLTDASGNANLPEFSGSGDGVRAALCAGRSPATGPNIPGQIVTFVQPDLTRMRVFRVNGAPLANATVRINCVLSVSTAQP